MFVGLLTAAQTPQVLRKVVSSRGALNFAMHRTLWGKTTIWLNVFLFVLLVMVGWGFTAFVYLCSYVGMIVIGQIGKGSVKTAIEGLYNRDKGDGLKNITPVGKMR